MLLRTWESRREKRGEGDLTVGIPPLQIYRSFRDERTRPNLDRSSRRNSAHAPARGVGDLELRRRVKTPVAAPLPPATSPPYSDQSPLPTQPRFDTMHPIDQLKSHPVGATIQSKMTIDLEYLETPR
nr:hypothetical protein Iba_chr04bCG16440 [Ipomoea batatas]